MSGQRFIPAHIEGMPKSIGTEVNSQTKAGKQTRLKLGFKYGPCPGNIVGLYGDNSVAARVLENNHNGF